MNRFLYVLASGAVFLVFTLGGSLLLLAAWALAGATLAEGLRHWGIFAAFAAIMALIAGLLAWDRHDDRNGR